VQHGKEGTEYNNQLKEQVRFIEKKVEEKAFQNVAAGIILNDHNRVLITKRLGRTGVGDCWEFPGGKIREGELVEDCLKRELLEELSIQIANINPYYAVYHNYGNFVIRLFSNLCRIESGNIDLKDHSKYEWADPKTVDLHSMCPADRQIAEKLRSAI
jgi:8-oxo-dGTP diphosphatase